VKEDIAGETSPGDEARKGRIGVSKFSFLGVTGREKVGLLKAWYQERRIEF